MSAGASTEGVQRRPLEELVAFVRERTRPASVPLVPELTTYQASEFTSLWHATTAELAGWDPGPYWAFAWAGGQALARYLLDHPEVVRGKSAFDFATGGGVVALAAARAGARRVVACDLDPFSEAAVALNAELNRTPVEFRAGDPLGDPLTGFDVVLAGDVFYERRLAQDSLAWLSALAGRGVLALAGDPDRVYSPTAGVAVISCYDVPTSPEIEATPTLRARVVQVLPPR